MTKNNAQYVIEFESSQTLEQTITSFKAATTTQDRQALQDQVITAWANTSSLGDAKARNPLPTNSLLSNGGGWYVSSPAQAIADFAQSQSALYAQLSALKRFNGQSVIERYTRATNASYYDAATGTYKGYTFYSVSIEPQRLPFFQTAYDSLKASTYQSLYLQTEGKQLLDQIELVIDDKGLRLDFAAVDTALARKLATDPSQAATDLAEFISFTTDSLASSGWDGAAQLGELLAQSKQRSNKEKACNCKCHALRSRTARESFAFVKRLKRLISKRTATCRLIRRQEFLRK